MEKVSELSEFIKNRSKFIEPNKSIVLVGGCFDILHVGHFSLFDNAKKEGDILVVLLESDKKIQKTKGLKRPLHSQNERAYMLSLITSIDLILKLPFLEKNEDYDKIIEQIKPKVIATTKNDPSINHKKRQAEKIGAAVKEVISYIPEKSSTNILNVLLKED